MKSAADCSAALYKTAKFCQRLHHRDVDVVVGVDLAGVVDLGVRGHDLGDGGVEVAGDADQGVAAHDAVYIVAIHGGQGAVGAAVGGLQFFSGKFDSFHFFDRRHF